MRLVSCLARPVVAMLFVLATFVPAWGQPVRIASVEDAIRVGTERNLAVMEAQKQVGVSEAGVKTSLSPLLPQASLDLAYFGRDAVFALGQTPLPDLEKEPGFFFGYTGESYMRLRVDQNILSLPALRGRSVARLDQGIQEKSRDATLLDVKFEVTRAYYTVLLSRQILTIKQELVEQAKRHQTDVAARLQAGEAARFDKLRADVQLANLYPELTRAENAVDVNLAVFKNVLGLQQGEDVEVSGTIEYVPEDVDLPAAVSQATEQRPELAMTRLSRDLFLESASMQQSQNYPTLGAFYQHEFRADSFGNMFDERQRAWTVGLVLNVPFFDGGRSIYKAREDKARAARAEVSQERVKRNIEVEVMQAGLELRRAKELIDSQLENVKQAEEAMQIANKSYVGGLVINSELLDTQTQLDAAKVNLVTAIYDYLINRARYHRAIGR
jgi:outer membrane protein